MHKSSRNNNNNMDKTFGAALTIWHDSKTLVVVNDTDHPVTRWDRTWVYGSSKNHGDMWPWEV